MVWMVELAAKPGANVNTVLWWILALKVSVAYKCLIFASQDFQVHRIWTFVDQIHILWYDILREKTLLFDIHPMLIFGKSEQKFSITSTFAIIVSCKTFYYINQIFFFIRDVFCERIFSKEYPIGFRGSVFYWKAMSYHQNHQMYDDDSSDGERARTK